MESHHHSRRKFIRNAATGLLVPSLMSSIVRGSVPLPLGFFNGSSSVAGPSVLPSDFSNMAFWYRSMDLALADGDPVGTWVDRSSNHNDATITGTARPLFKTSILSGQPALRFDASDDHMNFSIFSMFADFTILLLVKPAAAGVVFLGRWGIVTYLALGVGGPANCVRIYNTGTSEGLNSSTFGGVETDAKLVVLRKIGSTLTFRENKTARGSGSYGTWQLDAIGAAGNAANGDYFELAVFNGTGIADADLDSLYDNYFKFYYPSLP